MCKYNRPFPDCVEGLTLRPTASAEHAGQACTEKKMQASLLLILQDVTHVIPCTDRDSLMGTCTMSEDVPTIDEIVEVTFGEKIADVSHNKEGPYQDRPPLCPFRLSPLLTCS